MRRERGQKRATQLAAVGVPLCSPDHGGTNTLAGVRADTTASAEVHVPQPRCCSKLTGLHRASRISAQETASQQQSSNAAQKRARPEEDPVEQHEELSLEEAPGVHRITPRGCLTSQGGPDGDPHGTLRQVIC